MHPRSCFACLLSAEHGFDFVFLESRISGQQNHVLLASLGNQHAVEGVAVVPRKFARMQSVNVSDFQRTKRQCLHACGNEL